MIRLLTVIVLVSSLVGCNKQSGVNDLKNFTKNAYKDRKPQVDPLPAVKPVEVFIYQASKETDPFNQGNLKKQSTDKKENGGGEDGPDLTRRKEPLEAYPTDALKLVGVMEQNGITWAIVNAPDSTVHRVTEGNYLGRNHGQITLVKGRRVNVVELVRNPVGKWEKKPAKLLLVE
jgi:type IV pilus assembly protein PilP